MIKDRRPVAMFEVEETLSKVKETDKTKNIQEFIKKFSNLDSKKSKKLKEDLEALDIIKLKRADILKIVDFVPENATELNKIVTEANLDTDETNKILDAIKNNK
jgi:DNA-directed RNA polymerase subunit F